MAKYSSESLSPTTDVVTVNQNSENTYSFPAGTRHFSMQCRTANDVLFSFKQGQVNGGSQYNTMKAGGNWSTPEKLYLAVATILYLNCTVATVVVEISYWS